MEHPFLARLRRGPLLADGAMGTELYARGIAPAHCFEATNIDHAELVQRIHLDYLAAGAELIETNTFGANGAMLAPFAIAERVREINRRGARLARYARDIAGSTAWIAGAIGPLGVALHPLGEITAERARDLYREQIEGLLDGGVDLFILETFGDLNMLCLALQTVRELSELPVIAQATFDEDGRTPLGQSALKVANALRELQADVIGVNCGAGPEGVLGVAQQLVAAGAPYVSAMPNAGLPSRAGGRLIYRATPAYLAARVPEFLQAGVTVLGGCCGTTPAHIAAMRQALDAALGQPAEAAPTATALWPAAPAVATSIGPEGAPAPTRLKARLAEGAFVVAVELSPPRSLNADALLRHARALAASGVVDAINITDSPMARVRMDALAACQLIQAQTGGETILHLTTRDRNLMGLQAHLIGAHALGVRNILALTGDPPSLGDASGATGVYDIDSIGLVRIIQQMNQGHDLAGGEMGSPAGFCVGVAVDPTKPDLATEARRLKDKLAAGAEFVMTQPIYDLAVWERFLEVYGEPIAAPVLLGLLPLLSQRHAEFLHNEVPGITVSDEALARMRAAGGDGHREGVRLAQELLLAARDRFAGVYLMPSYNRHETALEVLSVLDRPTNKERP